MISLPMGIGLLMEIGGAVYKFVLKKNLLLLCKKVFFVVFDMQKVKV